ncbi:MAG: 2-dehydro-3-deoxygalactonokinase [Pseudomonadota bacterium]
MIALDWGLSSFRAFRLAPDGAVIDQRSAPAGILAIADRQFEATLVAQLGDWLAGTDGRPDRGPIVAAGMIGSRQGWVEAPYVPCPAGVAELAAQLHRRPTTLAGDVWFVPGASWSTETAIDVMRGEETQIVGGARGARPRQRVAVSARHAQQMGARRGRPNPPIPHLHDRRAVRGCCANTAFSAD